MIIKLSYCRAIRPRRPLSAEALGVGKTKNPSPFATRMCHGHSPGTLDGMTIDSGDGHCRIIDYTVDHHIGHFG
jgi:hypothetical protein